MKFNLYKKGRLIAHTKSIKAAKSLHEMGYTFKRVHNVNHQIKEG